ncbi:uncharacterized protein LOC124937084 [Impatiens glandulifera]|uniref:uncharacterized protein LOC124937084 n=1 Tax=Impatiens glandulifera TaxID=253017 RepID=UPI001FB0FE24|nr:uncharacterized protein LOC124937084 [Impatiens glandulifera]
MCNSPEGLPTPPLQTPVSIPFNWEEAPGKPRRHDIALTKPKPKAARSLELPPAKQMVSNNSSPSLMKILEGGESGKGVTHTLSFSFGKLSFQSPEEAGGSKRQMRKEGINSNRWNLSSWRWGSFRRNEVADGGNMDFLSSVMVDDENSPFQGQWSSNNVKKTRFNKPNFLTSIYKSFKQAVPWRRKQEGSRKKKMAI